MATAKITKRLVDDFRKQAQTEGQALFCWDADLAGFGIKAGKSGGVAYIIQYRTGGRGSATKRMTLGKHGALTPDEARKLAREKLGNVARGGDPAREKKEARRKLAGGTLQELCESWLAEREKAGGGGAAERRRLITRNAFPPLGSRALTTITKGDMAALFRTTRNRSPSAERGLFGALNPFFKWAVAEDLLDANPMAGLQSPPPAKKRDRVLTDHELVAFWKATKTLDWPFGPALRLLLLTGQRENEVGGMSWSELDRATLFWRIPAARCKNGMEHLVDLSPQASRILNTLPRMECAPGLKLVFTTTGATPVSGWSNAKRQLDRLIYEELNGKLWGEFVAAAGGRLPAISKTETEEDKQRLDAAAQKLGFLDAEALTSSIMPPWRIHDLRRTAATGMAALGFPPHVVERVINHISGAQGGLTGVYQHHEYRAERMDALMKWGERVEQIVSGADRA